jgi:tetratricopeptide (TPR) repeat protein
MESTVMSRCRLVSLVRLVVLAVVVTAPACKANEGTNATADAGHSSAEASLKPIARTTDGAIAIGNLDAVVAGQEKRVAAAPGDATLRAGLVELLLTRGQYIGSIADYERASEMAEALVREAPKSAEAWKARAGTNATWHRFDAALADLDAAERAGASSKSLKGARSSIFAAVGKLDEAFAIAPSDGDLAGESLALASRGLLEGSLGRVADSDADLAAARTRYRDVSPLPLAWMDAMQAAQCEKRGDRVRAHAFYTRAVRILPLYATAAAHLASYETAERAVAILSPVAERSDDPEVLAELGDALRRVGRADESQAAIGRARARYDALMTKHPEAFADHAARFWLGVGGEPVRALPLAASNAELRSTDEALSLWLEAAQAARDERASCAAARRLAALPHATDALRAPATAVLARCTDGG